MLPVPEGFDGEADESAVSWEGAAVCDTSRLPYLGVITITTTWLVHTRPGSRVTRVHSLSAPYTYFVYPPTHHLLNTLIF